MRTLFILLFFVFSTPLFAQQQSSFLVAWWNVEALYDTRQDSTTDADFTPSGKYQWTEEKLRLKFQRLAQTIRDLAQSRGFTLPDVMGFCNVEHQWLLDTLFQKYLKTNDFQTVYFESSDAKGRDIGVVFNRRKFSLTFAGNYAIMLDTVAVATRDIILVKLDYRGKLLNLIFNHWEEPKLFNSSVKAAREQAARLVRSIIASLQEGEKEPNIVVVGDFNITPNDPVFSDAIRASGDSSFVRSATSDFLLNLSLLSPNSGTARLRAKWYAFDQALVSAFMLDQKDFYVFTNALQAFSAPYLFQPSRRSDPTGQLFSTFFNERYIGGYSNRLPISVVVHFK